MVLDHGEPTPEGSSDVLGCLGAEGIVARFTCLFVPVQLERHLASGEPFSFRCRYDSCSLSVAPPDGNPVGAPTWFQRVTRWEEFEAGYVDHDEAGAVFR